MPSPAPRAELAGGVQEDAASAAVSGTASQRRAWRWAGFAGFLVVLVVLFDAYLHLSQTYPENSDEANILLMANDMLHGNVYLSGWNVSDVPFITTELPEIALLVWLFGLHLNTAHIAAALTYTLVIAVAMLLAKGRARGPQAIARMALVLAIMLAPQPGVGVFVMIFSVGHIGTAAPVMLTWLILDRFAVPPLTVRRHWWVPVVVAVMLGWALMADPLVLVIAIFPMLVVCLARVLTGLFTGLRNGPGLRAVPQVLEGRWLEFSLAAAAGVGYLVVLAGRQLLTEAGGYVQQPVPFALDGGRWFMQARVVVHGLLAVFGAYFVPGNAINYLSPGSYVVGPGLSGLDQAIAITRVACVIMAVWGCCAIARRFFRRDADFVSQLLLVGIVANLAAYIPSSLADHTALNVREIAPVLPFAAVIAGRMLGDRLLWGPVVSVKLPASARSIRWLAIGRAPGGTGGRPPGRQQRQPVRVKLLAVPLVALFGWYSFGLFYQAQTPAAPNPFAQLEAFLEANHLSYGIGGYWNASVITVDTGGKVTIRAVTPACLQPYQWESKTDWYNPSQHVANFLLLANVAGYFSEFEANGAALDILNDTYPGSKRLTLEEGGYFLKKVPGDKQPVKIWYYDIRWYQGNLLADLPKIDRELNNAQPAGQNPHPKLNAC